MIFATVGTHGQPFARFFDIVKAAREIDDELIVQYGHNPRPAGIEKARAFMSFGEIEAHARAADAVITHAGVGSVLTARRAGHRPLVVARLRYYGEHVDDHQVELVRRLAGTDQVLAIATPDELPGALADAAGRRESHELQPTRLHAAVRAALLS